MAKKLLAGLIPISLLLIFSSFVSAQIVVENASAVWEEEIVAPLSPPEIPHRIVAEYVTSLSENTVVFPDRVLTAAQGVLPRILVEYGTSISTSSLQRPTSVLNASETVPPRVVVEYATSISVDTFSTSGINRVDYDRDGLPDLWEAEHGLDNTDPSDALADIGFDNDGLTNIEEFLNGTYPNNPDTDGDGVSDGDEVHHGGDPNSYNYIPSVPGTTIITHGWRLLSGEVDWAIKMAEAIAVRANGGEIYYVKNGNINLYKIVAGSASIKEKIVIFDWVDESSKAQFGFAEAAGDSLTTILIEGAIGANPLWSLSRLHFIGHSRGTIVNSEAIQRLIYLASTNPSVGELTTRLPEGISLDKNIHMTTLDPHPWDKDSAGNFLLGSADDDQVNQFDNSDPQGIIGWKSVTGEYKVSYIDNYISWYSDQIFLMGRKLYPGVNHITDLSCETKTDMDHSNVHEWYRGSIWWDINDPTDPLQLYWYSGWQYPPCSGSLGNLHVGYNISRIAGNDLSEYDSNPNALISVEDDNTFTDYFGGYHILFNSDFAKSDSGWRYQGGGGSATIVDDGKLQLTPAFVFQTNSSYRQHNKFYIPTDINRMTFSYELSGENGFYTNGNKSSLLILMVDSTTEYIVDTIEIDQNFKKSGTLNVDIDPFFRGKVLKLKIILSSSKSTFPNRELYLDNIKFYSDYDLDGVPSTVDNCPTDPNKVEAGSSGCENLDTLVIPQRNITVVPTPGVSVTFSEVTSSGDVSAAPTSNPSQPTSFRIVSSNTTDINFTGGFTGLATVCMTYDENDAHNESNLKLYHWEVPSWQDITTSLDTVANVVCGETMSFSPFAVGEPDADSDGLPDADELIYGTGVNDPDSDDDGILDGWEVFYGLDPLFDDANEDADGDGISNIDEINNGTNPNVNEAASSTKVPIHNGLWLIPTMLTGLYLLRRRKGLSA